MRRWSAAVSLLSLLTAAACGNSLFPTRIVSDAANGQRIIVPVGQRILVRLDSTDWTFQPVSGARVVRQSGQVGADGPVECGIADCGSVAVRLITTGPGTAIVRATRVKCGELIFCTKRNGTFTLVIRVRS